jgi:hypothetical protein
LTPEDEKICTGEFVDFFDHLLVLFFQLFNGFGIRSHSISFEEVDFGLVERDVAFLFFLLGHKDLKNI